MTIKEAGITWKVFRIETAALPQLCSLTWCDA